MNPHTVLGVDQNATPEQIKSAYRKMAMAHHPDRNGDSEESKTKFREIQEAYEALTKKPQQSNGGPSFNGSPFEDIFHGFRFHREEPRNNDFAMNAGITLEQAYNGCTITVSVNGKEIAVTIPAGVQNRTRFTVEGEGARDNAALKPGNLFITILVQKHHLYEVHGPHLTMPKLVSAIDCLLGCEVEITTIGGEKLSVKVPKGSSHNTHLRLAGKGMPWGDKHGDLIILVNPVFEQLTDAQCDILRTVKNA